MANNNSEKPGREPIPPNVRRRLQQCYEHGSKMSAQGNFDYASEMFTQCVVGDPGNKIYVKSFLGNLQKKYGNNKKGSKLAFVKGAGSRSVFTKATVQKDWSAILKSGLDLLKLNPWDVSVLSAMANASEELELDDSQLIYLQGALEANIKDPEVNRLAGRALARQGFFDEALLCWNRVLQGNKAGDEEASRAISDLTVKKTIREGGYEDAESSQEVKADRSQPEDDEPGLMRLTPERQLERAIAKDPSEVQNYLRYFELLIGKERYEDAEKILVQALQVSGNDPMIAARLEDMRLKRMLDQVAIARRKAEQERTPEAIELYKNMKVEQNKFEMEVYRKRVERFPTNIQYKYELGVRLQTAGMYQEAIKQFQDARQDPQKKGIVFLRLGQCFVKIGQNKLAMSNFEAAVAEIPDRDPDGRKAALYQAGVMAMHMGLWDKAEAFMTELAGMEFGYKDVAQRLDKIAEERHKG